MSTMPRMKTMVYCVGLAVAQWGLISVAHADSAVGNNTILGNARNPAAVNATSRTGNGGLDVDSMAPAKHTPSGQLYDVPNDVGAEAAASSFNAVVEGGVTAVSGDKSKATFKTYKDVRTGAALDAFSLQGENRAEARFVEATGGGVGRDDQFYGVQFGRYNDWKVKAFYNETPHVFTSNFKSFWGGAGTGNLTLPANIPAAGGMTCVSATGAASPAGTCTNFISPAYGINPSATPPATVVAASATSQANGAASFIAPNIAGSLPTNLNYLVTQRLTGAVNSAPDIELGIVRKSGGVALDMNLTDTMKLFASYSLEKRKGARPFAEVQGGGGGANQMEIVEPIDYDTHELQAGLRYVRDLTSFNLTASASNFRNNIGELTFQQPFVVAGSALGPLLTQGRFDLYPSNDAYNVKGEFAQAFPEFYNARFTGTASWGSSRQNDPLLPWTVNSGMGATSVAVGTFNGNLNQWNTAASLSQASSNARIDNKLIELKLALTPAKDLNVAGKLRMYETDNSTNFLACNPNATYGNGTQYSAFGCTGVWGRLITDGGGNALLNPGTFTSGNILVSGQGGTTAAAAGTPSANIMRSIPWDYKQTTYSLSADYRLNRSSSLSAALEREDMNRRNRERAKTWEDKLKLGYVDRKIADGTLRLSYEVDRKRGSEYEPTAAYEAYVASAFFNPATLPAGASVSGWVDRNALLRKYDQADRDQNILNARLNWQLRDNLDFGTMLQLKDIKYPDAQFGRNDKQNLDSLNFDLNYQRSAEQVMYGYYSYQTGKMAQANTHPGAPNIAPAVAPTCSVGNVIAGITVSAENAEALCGNPYNNILFNSNNNWSMGSKDKNHVIGIGLKQAMGTSVLDVNLGLSQGTTKISYAYNAKNAGAVTAPSTTTPGITSVQATGPAGTVNTTATGAAGTAYAQGLIGGGFSDLKTNILSVNMRLTVPLSKQMATIFSLYHETGKINDWHYDGLTPNNMVMTSGTGYVGTMLDGGPQNYKTTVLGVMLQVKL